VIDETYAQIIALACIVVFALLGRAFDNTRPSLNWDTTDEEAREAAEFASYCNKRGESHLRLVSNGEHGTTDVSAIRR
jgi:hypothetical protein